MFKVYSSSAGSGKTYTLTKEYLKLALGSESETYFRSILAVTFTNAAANEMKDRILTMLRLFATPEGTAHPMLRDIVHELHPETLGNPDAFAEYAARYAKRAGRVFRKVLHRYSDFSVMTIDKFTQRLVSSFTDELGIPFAFETQIESDQLANAVDRMLARIGQEGETVLTQVVETYYRESARDGKSWGSLPERIREAAYDLLNEKSYLAMLKVKDLSMTDWIGIRQQMADTMLVIDKDAHCKVLVREAFGLLSTHGLVAGDFAGGSRGLIGYFDKFSPEDEETEEWWKNSPSDSITKNLEEDKWYGGKASKDTKTKIDGIKAQLEALYNQILAHQSIHRERFFLFEQLEKHLYNLSLLGEIRQEFDSILRQGNQVHISDFNRKVMEIVAKEPVPFIFERLGEKYNHILVDEFQDTSKLQFANLLPMIDNALGFGNFNLIVGDAKQSIYRFRGGDMDLILHLSQNQVGHLAGILGESDFTAERLLSLDRELQVDHLKTNRRSYREITEFNNGFFTNIAAGVAAEHGMVASVFDENFAQQMTPDVSTGGRVQIEFLDTADTATDDDTSEESPKIMVARTLELVDELREKGYHWRDIAILCRGKAEAADIAAALKARGNPLISDDSLLLTYAQTVNLLVSFMQVLQTPDNALARYEAAYLFHRIILKKIPTAAQHEQIRTMCGARDTTSFLQYFEAFDMEFSAFKLRQLGVYELCEKLITTFQLFEGLAEAPYIFRFMDAILAFGTRNSNHLADFLAYWETAKKKISITVPTNADALRITTIHKSKGLEYPVVIVPNCNWRYVPNGNRDRIWVDLDAIEESELSIESSIDEHETATRKLNSSVVSMVKDLSDTPLAAEYEEESTRMLLENLNLLYVAFTRPVQRLYVLAKLPRGWEKNQSWEKCTGSVNRWLYDYLASGTAPVAWEPGKLQYVLNDGAADCHHSHKTDGATPHTVTDVVSVDRTDRLRLRRLAERIFDVETFEKKKDKLQKRRYALSLIETPKDVDPVLRQLVGEGILEAREAASLKSDLHTLMAEETMSVLFAEGTMTRLKKEFLLPNGKILAADRLTRLPDGREVVVSVVAGAGSDDSRRQLRRLLRAYQSMDKPASRGALIGLADGSVEWFD